MRSLARSSVLALLSALALLAGPAARARAHGRPPTFRSILVDPSDPDRWVAPATWGAAFTEDGGEGFRWVCSAAYGVDARYEDPHMLLMEDGSLLAGTYNGLRRSDPEGCAWTSPEPALEDIWVIDVHRAGGDPRRIYAIATDVVVPDQIYRSDDGGALFSPVGAPFDRILLDAVVSAPSDPDRIYIGASVPAREGSERQILLLRSEDGGGSTETIDMMPFLEAGERLALPVAVDPADPELLFARVLHFNGDMAPERIIRSEDGGRSWETVLRAPILESFLLAADGSRAWAGSALGGLYRSEDGGRSFDLLDETLPVRCLERIGEDLYACTDEGRIGYAIAVSMDEGGSWAPALRFEEVTQMLSCPLCSEVGTICPAWLPDISYDLGFDAGIEVMLEPDGGVGLPRDAGVPPECRPDAGPVDAGGEGDPDPAGCSCRAAGMAGPRGGPPFGLALGALVVALGFLLALSSRRRRRTGGAARPRGERSPRRGRSAR